MEIFIFLLKAYFILGASVAIPALIAVTSSDFKKSLKDSYKDETWTLKDTASLGIVCFIAWPYILWEIHEVLNGR